MFYIVGIGIAFFLAAILFTKKNRTTADTVLGAWVVLIGIHVSLHYAIWVAKPITYPHLLGLEVPMPILQNVFLYLYIGTLTQQIYIQKRGWLWHLLPTVAAYGYMLPFFSLPESQRAYVYAHGGLGYELFADVLSGWYMCSGVIYVIACALFLRRYRLRIFPRQFGQQRSNLNWMRGLLIGMVLIWLIAQVLAENQYIYGAVVIFVLGLGYFGIRQGNIFADWSRVELVTQPALATPSFADIAPTSLTDTDTKTHRKYARSGLTQETATSLHNRLTELMTQETLYTEPELSLSDLANRLDVPPNYLSQVINEREGMSFPDYLSSLRIEAFKRLAADPKSSHLTLLALAYECGFNSKSTFNRQFKKRVGQLPSAYWQQADTME